jgi:hypothetical protein
MRLRSILALPLAAALAFAACSNQGEGQICDRNAGNGGNDDCENGLVCVASPNPNIHGFRCCPASGASTTVECSQPGQTLDASTAPPDASSDGPAEASPSTGGGGGSTGDAASPADGATSDAPAASPDAGTD